MSSDSQQPESPLWWASRGFGVFRCKGKIPDPRFAPHGKDDATTDLEEIGRWPTGVNYGIVPKPGTFVVDVDQREALQALEALHGDLPATLTVETGSGGLHLWFAGDVPQYQHPKKCPGCADPRHGLDTRAAGKGYVVGPGSIHPDTGKPYRVLLEEDIAEAPAWLVALYVSKGKSALQEDFTDPDWKPPPSSGRDAAGPPPSPRATRTATPPPRGSADADGDARSSVAGDAWDRGGGSDYPTRIVRKAEKIGQRVADRTGEGQGGRDTLLKGAGVLGGNIAFHHAEQVRERVESILLEACGEAAGRWKAAKAIASAVADGMTKPTALGERDRDPEPSSGSRSTSENDPRPEPPPVEDAPSAYPHAVQDGIPYIVLVGKHDWYLKCADSTHYVAVAEKTLRTEVRRTHPHLPVDIKTEAGRVPMGPSMLFERYGRRADALVWSYTGESGYTYDKDGGGTLVLRCCKLDPRLEAEYSQEVHDWLSILFGDQLDRVYDWTACGILLDRPIAALYIEGKNGAGKGMYAEGFARMWGPHLADYSDVMMISSPFNAIQRFTPVIRLEERAPRSPNGSARFRAITGNSTHPLYEKNKTAATLLGCPRQITTANNSDAYRFGEGEQLTAEDEEAIAVRILHVIASMAARDFLIELGGRSATREWVTREDGSPGIVPRHLYWVTQNWTVKQPGTRFLVDGSPGDWLRNAHLRSGDATTLLDALGNYHNSQSLRKRCGSRQPIRYDEQKFPGVMIVSNQRLRECWSILMGRSEKVPSHNTLAETLAKVSRAGRERPRLSDGTMPWGYVVELSKLGDRIDPAEDPG